jgi:hypothetical protein
MDKQQACNLLQEQLGTYRRLPYAALAARIGTEEHLEVVGLSGVRYQIEILVLWDSVAGGNVRVNGAVDDGGLRAFLPLCAGFLMAPDGTCVGE